MTRRPVPRGGEGVGLGAPLRHGALEQIDNLRVQAAPFGLRPVGERRVELGRQSQKNPNQLSHGFSVQHLDITPLLWYYYYTTLVAERYPLTILADDLETVLRKRGIPAGHLLTVPKIAKEIGKTRQTVFRWITKGQLPAYRVGSVHLVIREDLEAFAAVPRPSGRPSVPETSERDDGTITLRLRFAVLDRDGFTCRYCGRSAPDVALHVDHVHPLSKGGKATLDNLVTACRECNLGKGSRLLSRAFGTLATERDRQHTETSGQPSAHDGPRETRR